MSEKITFKELVAKISAKTDQSEQTTDQFIHQLAEIIETSLSTGEKISISGFGKFELRWRDERQGRNPQTGEEITIPGQNKVVFKPYKALKEHINRPYNHLEPVILKETPESQDRGNEPKDESSSESSETDFLKAEPKTDLTPDRKEVLDDLITEKPSPVESKIPFTPEETKGSPSEVPLRDLDQWEEMKSMDREKLSREVQKNGRFRWSYTAASIVVLLAIVLLVFTIYRSGDETDTALSNNDLLQNTPVIEESIDEPVSGATTSEENPSEAGETEHSESQESESTSEFVTHQISSGESLWTIAEREYGNPYLWPLIYSENKDTIENPNRITAGNEIELPSLRAPENLTTDERERVALGYISVYDWVINNQPESARYYLWAAGSFSSEILQEASDRVDEADLAFATQR